MVVRSKHVYNVQCAIVVEADGHDLCRSVLDSPLVLLADVQYCLESGKSTFGLCTLLCDLWRLARKDFEFFVCQA